MEESHLNKQTKCGVASVWLTVFTCTKRFETFATIRLYLRLYLREVSWDNLVLTVMQIAMNYNKLVKTFHLTGALGICYLCILML